MVPVVVSSRPFSRGFVPSGQSRGIFIFFARIPLTVQSVSAPTTVNMPVNVSAPVAVKSPLTV